MDPDQFLDGDWLTSIDWSSDEWTSLDIDLNLDPVDFNLPIPVNQDVCPSSSIAILKPSPLSLAVDPSPSQPYGVTEQVQPLPDQFGNYPLEEVLRTPIDPCPPEASSAHQIICPFPKETKHPQECVSGNVTSIRRITTGGMFLTFSLDSRPVRASAKPRISESRRKEIAEMRSIGSCVLCRRDKRPCDKGHPCSRCSRLARGLCIRENLPAKAICHIYSPIYEKDRAMETLRNEIGQWTGDKTAFYLMPFWGDWKPATSPWDGTVLEVLPFPLETESYIPRSKSGRVMWYSFGEQRWFSPHDSQHAIRRTETIKMDDLGRWACDCVEEFLCRQPSWRNVFLLNDEAQAYILSNQINAGTVRKAMQFRGMAFILKCGFVAETVSGYERNTRHCCPRTIFLQIKSIIQQRCSALEKELLLIVQQSIFDPKRLGLEALPNFYTLILLLSTYSFLGSCHCNGEMHTKGLIVQALTSHYKRAYEGYPGLIDPWRTSLSNPGTWRYASTAAIFGSINNLSQMMASAGVGGSDMVPYMTDYCNSLNRAIATHCFRATLSRTSEPQKLQKILHIHDVISVFAATRLRHQSLGRGSYEDWLLELERNHHWMCVGF